MFKIFVIHNISYRYDSHGIINVGYQHPTPAGPCDLKSIVTVLPTGYYIHTQTVNIWFI